MAKTIVCYPLKWNGSKWSNNELLHSLRSLQLHFKGEIDEVYLLADKYPEWGNPETLKFIHCPQYVETLKAACRLAGEGGRILWMNDDILFMKDTTWDDLVSPVRRESCKQMNDQTIGVWLKSSNGWMKRLGQIMKDLKAKGYTTWRFSTHTPYAYERDLLLPIVNEYAKLGYKVSVENAYYNIHLDKFGETPIVDMFRSSKKKNALSHEEVEPIRFLNLTDGGIGTWMRGFIRGRFYQKSIYEKQG